MIEWVDKYGERRITCFMFTMYLFYSEKRQQGRLAGFSLYISNTGVKDSLSLCYKDGPQLPTLNFTINCMTSGRHVIFYNERMDEANYPQGYELNVVSTELCEVIVLGDIFDHFLCLFIDVFLDKLYINIVLLFFKPLSNGRNINID